MVEREHFETEKYELDLWTEIMDPDYVVRGNIGLAREERLRRGNRDLSLEIGEVAERLRNVEKYRKFSNAVIEITKLLLKKEGESHEETWEQSYEEE